MHYTFSQDVLDPPHVGGQLPVDLLDPDDGPGHGRDVPHPAHPERLALGILNLELLVKSFNIVLDPLDQLSLVLSNGASDVRAHKQGVEPDDKRVKLSLEFTKKVMELGRLFFNITFDHVRSGTVDVGQI